MTKICCPDSSPSLGICSQSSPSPMSSHSFWRLRPSAASISACVRLGTLVDPVAPAGPEAAAVSKAAASSETADGPGVAAGSSSPRSMSGVSGLGSSRYPCAGGERGYNLRPSASIAILLGPTRRRCWAGRGVSVAGALSCCCLR